MNKNVANNLKIFLKRIIGLALLPPSSVSEYWEMVKLNKPTRIFDCIDDDCECENEEITSLESYISYSETMK
jgi:hypothetical protein